MAILTTEKVKEFLQITSTTYDTLINALIVEAESLYLLERNLPFYKITGNTTTGNFTIESISNLKAVSRMDLLSSTSQTGIITAIDTDNGYVTLDTAATATTEEENFIVYPKGYRYIASKIIGWLMSKQTMSGVKSESFRSYSYENDDMSVLSGLPQTIANNITTFAGVK
jgi:hypothetical protein